MLKLTKKADYGLIALKHLAQAREGQSCSAKEIADRYRIPLPLLSKVLQKLAKSGFLESEQGTNGGYRLKRPPEMVSVLEVVRTIDGPIILTSCFSDDNTCDQSSKCSVREPLKKVHESILALLGSISIAALLDEESTAPACGSGVQLMPVLMN